MVAIVTGTGLGLDRSSADVLGERGQTGQLGSAAFNRFGENVFVNAANGNLVIERTDEILIGQGPDSIVARAYNSQNTNLGYGAAHGWQTNDARCVFFNDDGVHSIGQNGSSVTRIDSDGSDMLFTWDNTLSAYVCHQAGHAGERITFDDSSSPDQWIWRDAKNGITERYNEAHDGRILSCLDDYGKGLSYAYDNTTGKLNKITTQNGDKTEFDYGTDGTHVSIKTTTAAGAVTRAYYDYDSSGRLIGVTTDLTPSGSSISDGVMVTTNYYYVTGTDRIRKITQTGGAQVEITYDSSNRVQTIAQTVDSTHTITTSIDYSTPGAAVITDNVGNVATMSYDSQGRLTGLALPTSLNGHADSQETIGYNYVSDGLVKTVTDGLGYQTKYTYDSNDNLTQITDPLGNKINYTYDSNNHVTIMVRTPGTGQEGAKDVTRYAYNANGSMAYVVTADGGVTEYDYDGVGNRTGAVVYRFQNYNLTGLTDSDVIPTATLNSWVSTLISGSTDLSTLERVKYEYDTLGNLTHTTTYTSCDANGNGLTATSAVVDTTFDQFGNLTARKATNVVGDLTHYGNTEQYTYDGLGRLTFSVDLNGGSTDVEWTDSLNSCAVTSNGVMITSAYDKMGNLITVTNAVDNSLTRYSYDDLGHLGKVKDATNHALFYLYDGAGRRVAQVTGDGEMTEYRYDADNNVIATVRYATKLNSTQITALQDSTLHPLNPDLDSERPGTPSADDAWTWSIYDKDNRLVQSIDGEGGLIAFTYDDNSNLTSTTAYTNKVTVSGFKSLTGTPLAKVSVTGNPVLGVTRNYYDSEDRLIGTLNADGYLTQTMYDQAGEVTQQISYATQITTPDDFGDMVDLVSGGGGDEITRLYYDGRGLLSFKVDAKLQVTEYVRDAVGRITNTIVYADAIAVGDTDTLAEVDTAVGAVVSADRQTFQVYDEGTGQLVYMIDSMGGVTQYVYGTDDDTSRLVHTTQFATLRSTSTSPAQSTMDTWAAGTTTTDDRTTRMVYNDKGELGFVIDGDKYVTEYQYDVAGRKTLEVRYAEVYSSLALDPEYADVDTATSTHLSTAAQTVYAYDTNGRLSTKTEDSGGLARVTKYEYDALDRLVKTTLAYGTADAAVTTCEYDTANRLVSQTSEIDATHDATTSFAYDAMGRMATQTDARNNVTHYYYDAAGNLTQVTDAAGSDTYFDYDAFGNVIRAKDDNGKYSYTFYDKLNRKAAAIDRMGFWTTYEYNVGGALTKVTQGATAYTGTITMGTTPSSWPSGANAITVYAYNELDRLTSVTDAMGFTETYGLDTFGDRVNVWMRSYDDVTTHLGGKTVYTYSHRGQVLTETLPTNSRTGGGTVELALNGEDDVINSFTYDAWGNLKVKVEAVGMTEQRTTTYTYDKLGRLTKTQGDAFDAISGDHFQTVTTVTPTTNYVYDLRDNLIETNDNAGGRTLSFYDDLDRKIAQVNKTDADNNKGVLTTWTYDANGNVLTAKVFGTTITMPDPHGTAPTGSGASRLTTYTYDVMNRLKTQSVASVNYGYYDETLAAYQYATGTITTLTNTYDALGNLVLQVDGRGMSTYSYYDFDGRKNAQVDGNGYLTKYTLDAFGNVTQEIRRARQYTGGDLSVDAPPTVAAWSGFDRITNFTYDLDGRCLTETRLGVVTATISGHTPTPTTVDSQVVYAYNGLGEVLTKTEATGESVTYTYDIGGRLTYETESGALDGGLHRKSTLYYDGLGDLVYRSVYSADGGAPVERTKYFYGLGGKLDYTLDSAGFEQDYAYDAAGRVAMVSYDRKHSDNSVTTEAQVTRYDLLGRAVMQSVATKGTGTTWNLGDQMQTDYDEAYGDVLSHSINGVVQQTMEYDALGRVWRQTDMGVAKVFFYDQAGQVTAEVDTTSLNMTSGADLRTITLSSLLTRLTAGGLAIGAVDVQGLAVTLTERDAMGKDIKTLQPFRQLAIAGSGFTTATLSTARTYNAFGEVLTQTDELGHNTTYTYNTMGRVVKQVLPSVSWTDVDGSTASVTPTTEYYYDASGRLIATKDANGNTNTRVLVANTGYGGSEAKVLVENHTDGGTVTNAYDVFYNVIKTTDEVGQVTEYTYDLMNRLATVKHAARTTGATQLVDTYSYDGLGQRLTHYNSQLGSTKRDKTDYDLQGRVTSQTDTLSQTTTYTYAWDGTLTTAGLGTFGGWTKTTAIAALDDTGAHFTGSEQDDTAGRIIKKTDMESGFNTFTYNKAGLVAERDWQSSVYAPGTDETMTYSYFNTGLVSKEVSDTNYGWTTGTIGGAAWWIHATHDVITATFSYDKLGNRLTEKQVDVYHDYSQGWHMTHEEGNPNSYEVMWGDPDITDWTQLLEDSTATYDVLSRMTSLTDEGIDDNKNGVGDDETTIAITYDKNGNVRSRIATYHTLDATGAVSSGTTTQSDWYLYDNMNRMTRVKGSMSGGVMSRGTGTDIAYDDAGRRVTVTSTVSSSTNVETYNYTGDGLLDTVYIKVGAGTSIKRGDYTYDLMGRQIGTEEYDAGGTKVYWVDSTYNDSSQLTGQVTHANRSDGNWVWTATYRYNEDYNNDGDYTDSTDYYIGAVTDVYTTITKNGAAQTATDQSYGYEFRDGAVQTNEYYHSGSTYYGNRYYYDSRNHLTKAEIYDGVNRTVDYTIDIDGRILARDTEGVTNAPHERYTIFNGIQQGDVSNDGTSDVDYATSINRNTAASAGSGFFRNGSSSATSYADFDAAYDPINGLDGGANISHVTVQAGQNLQSIALMLWGDANLWYKLAEANGLDADAELTAGTSLIVPSNVYSNSNTSDTFRVYDPNRAIGNTSPTHPPRPVNHGNNCGVFGQILQTIVSVVVTIMTGNPLLGNIAGQIFGLATGIQKSFNWASLGITAITQGITQGLNLPGVIGDKSVFGAIGIAGDSIPAQFAQGALTSTLSQGIAVATGLQKSFNWTDVAAAGVSQAAGSWAAGEVSGVDFGSESLNLGAEAFVKGMAGDLAYATTRSLANGSDFGDNMLQGLPNVLAQVAGSVIAAELTGPSRDPLAGRQFADNGYNVAGDTRNDASPVQHQGFFDWLGDTITSDLSWLGHQIDSVLSPVERVFGVEPESHPQYTEQGPGGEYVVVTGNKLGFFENAFGGFGEVIATPLGHAAQGLYNSTMAAYDHPFQFAKETAVGTYDIARSVVNESWNIGTNPGSLLSTHNQIQAAKFFARTQAYASENPVRFGANVVGEVVLISGTAVAGGPELAGAPELEALSATSGFTPAELRIINEANSIVTSPKMTDLAMAHGAGESLTVDIGGRLIQYEPDLPASGMTMFGENGFVMGPDAFSSNLEHNQTVLHELYRLNFSNSANGVSAELAAQETQSAASFAARAAKHLP